MFNLKLKATLRSVFHSLSRYVCDKIIFIDSWDVKDLNFEFDVKDLNAAYQGATASLQTKTRKHKLHISASSPPLRCADALLTLLRRLGSSKYIKNIKIYLCM